MAKGKVRGYSHPPTGFGSGPIIQHEFAARSPRVWQDMARMLFSAANHLYRPFVRLVRRRSRYLPGLGIVLMLYGRSVENFLEGLLVAQGQPVLGPNGAIMPRYGNHGLLALAREGRVHLTHADCQLSGRLARAIAEGKYPIGLKPKSSLAELGFWMVFPTDHDHICRISSEIEDRLRILATGMGWRRTCQGSEYVCSNIRTHTSAPSRPVFPTKRKSAPESGACGE
jgi:hypothetical protein